MKSGTPEAKPLRRLLLAFLLALLPLGWLAHDYWQALDRRMQATEKNVALRLRHEARTVLNKLSNKVDKRLEELWKDAKPLVDEGSRAAALERLAGDELVKLAICYDLVANNAIFSSRSPDTLNSGPITHPMDEARPLSLRHLDRRMREVVGLWQKRTARIQTATLLKAEAIEEPRSPFPHQHIYREDRNLSYVLGRLDQSTRLAWGVVIDHHWLIGELGPDYLEDRGLSGQIRLIETTRISSTQTPLFAPDQMPAHLQFAVPVVLPEAFEIAKQRAQKERSSANLWLATLLIWALGMIGRAYQTAREDMSLAEMKANFVAAISHELKTPLAMIKMYAEMLVLGLVGVQKRPEDYHQIIIEESDRLTRLIDNVLEYSKIQKGTRRYHFESVDLRTLIFEAARRIEADFERAGLVCHVEIRESWRLQADKEAVSSALYNLLSNAAVHGGKFISITLSRRGKTYQVAVKDSGPGIPKSEHRKIFRPFYRIGSEESRTSKGTGLGLTLVSETMKAHGGRVRLISRPGSGATFTLIFPLSGAA